MLNAPPTTNSPGHVARRPRRIISLSSPWARSRLLDSICGFPPAYRSFSPGLAPRARPRNDGEPPKPRQKPPWCQEDQLTPVSPHAIEPARAGAVTAADMSLARAQVSAVHCRCRHDLLVHLSRCSLL